MEIVENYENCWIFLFIYQRVEKYLWLVEVLGRRFFPPMLAQGVFSNQNSG